MREEFIRKNGLAKQQETNPSDGETVDEPLSFVQEAEQENADPLVTEAEKLFGKEFIEVYDD